LLIRAFVGNPKLILLEEPSETLIEEQTEQLISLIAEKENVSILFSSSNEKLMEIADNIIEFKKGKVVFEGTYQSFKEKN